MKRNLLLFLAAAGMCAAIAGQPGEIDDAARHDDVSRIRALLATNAGLVKFQGKDDQTPLHAAAREGHTAAVTLLLESGADIHAKDVHGCTPLHCAVYASSTPVARLLLEHGAGVNGARTDCQATPLCFAAAGTNDSLVRLLLDRGAHPEGVPGSNPPPLFEAVMNARTNNAGMLLRAGARLGTRNHEGFTVLHVLAKHGNMEMTAWLLDHGADADLKDRLGFRPVDYVSATNTALAVLLEQHMKPRAPQSTDVRVGDAGDLNQIAFEGLKKFTAAQIREALETKLSFQLAAHPQAGLGEFLSRLRILVESGYHASGFPDARVIVTNGGPGAIVVRVTEGPEFRSGKIHVTCPDGVNSKELVKWLTTAAPGESRKSPLPGRPERPEDPLWETGSPANFSASWATQVVQQVDACLAAQGFLFPKTRVELRRDEDRHVAGLEITIGNEGPPGIIGAIHVTGLQRDTPAELQRFLKLKEGAKFSIQRLSEALQSLRDCARYRNFEITPVPGDPGGATSNRVDLDIRVVEQEGIPRLTDPLTPQQEALLKLCRWIGQFPKRDEDFWITFTNRTGTPLSWECILSPAHGLLFNSADIDGRSPLSLGILLDANRIQCCAWASSNRLDAPVGSMGGRFSLQLKASPPGSTNRYNLLFGGGFGTSIRRADPSASPLQFETDLLPAAFLDLTTRSNTSCTIERGTLVCSNDAMVLRADARSGRLIRVDGITDDPAWSLVCRRGIWGKDVAGFERRAAGLTNRYSPGRGVSSFLSLFVQESARLMLAEPALSTNAAARANMLAALIRLTPPEVYHPLDKIFDTNGPAGFNIPPDETELALGKAIGRDNPMAILSYVAMRFNKGMFPRHSWPDTVMRELALIAAGEGKYANAELERIFNEPSTGPIGCLTVSKLLASAGSPMSSRLFAQQGLSRLDPATFIRECNGLLTGDSGIAQSFECMTRILRQMPDAELEALADALPASEANLLRESSAALKAAPKAGPMSVLGPALQHYWEASLVQHVRNSLEAISEQQSPVKRKP
jgi:ankyrin repeat protein